MLRDKCCGVLLIVLFNSTVLFGQSREKESDSLISEYMQAQVIPGMSVSIVHNGTKVYSTSVGLSDLEMNSLVQSETLFRTASTLKPITAAAITQLVLEGKIDLNEPIQSYCSAYPEKYWKVTPKMLILHAGGIRPSEFRDIFNRDHYASVDSAIERFKADSLVAEPGTSVVYSNAGYTLLACAIEGASGVSYDEYVYENILSRALMRNTIPDNPLSVIPNRARPYMVRTKENTEQWQGLWQDRHLRSTLVDIPFNADPVDPTWSIGAGGYLTTPDDLIQFAQSLMAGDLLPVDYLPSLTRPSELPNGEMVDRSHGWILDEFEGHEVLHVIGSDWNGSSALWIVPEQYFAIAISTNKGFERPEELVKALAQLWIGQK